MKIVLMAVLIFFVLNSANASSNYTIRCPIKMVVTQSVTHTYPGWRSIITQPNHYLSGITLYSGKPEEMASLVPDSSDHGKSTWKISANEQIYIVCEYNQTSIQLTQALPAHTTSCTVYYEQNVRSSTGGYIPKQVLCTSNH